MLTRPNMKKLNNKGFSLVELLAVVSILAILTGIGMAAYNRYSEKAKNESYDILAKSAERAMEEYIMDHPLADNVTLEELYEGQYLERPTDPNDKSEVCRGRVIATKEDQEEGVLEETKYKVSICCSDHNYTYEGDYAYKTPDKYCKADPFSLEELKETIKEIKVLNVYPYHSSSKIYGNQLQNWMNTYGKGIIKVTPVYIVDFNKNPESYLGTKGNWKYDEVVFGFVDCNGNQDLSVAAASLVDDYLSSGGAAIFGHDTLTNNGCGSHKNFNTLAKHVNMTLNSGVKYASSTKVKIVKNGVFTEYPYAIGNIGTTLTIPRSHVYGQVAHGDIWITFDGTNDIDANKIYLSTYGNNAFIQTGHSNGAATADEQKIIANIIFYMVAKQYILE